MSHSSGPITIEISNYQAVHGIHSAHTVDFTTDPQLRGVHWKEAIAERKLFHLESTLGIAHGGPRGSNAYTNYVFRTMGYGYIEGHHFPAGSGPYLTKDAQAGNGTRISEQGMRGFFENAIKHGRERNKRLAALMLCLKALAYNVNKAGVEINATPGSVLSNNISTIKTAIENTIPDDAVAAWGGSNQDAINYSANLQKQLFTMSDTQICAASAAAEQYRPWSLETITAEADPAASAGEVAATRAMASPFADLLDDPWVRKAVKLILRNLVNGTYPKQGASVYRQPTKVNNSGASAGSYFTRSQRPSTSMTAGYNDIWGQNLKILSIGLPAGFVDSLQSESPATIGDPLRELPFQNPDHLVELKVYKLDLEFPDIVFYPKSFYFNTRMFVTPQHLVWRPFRRNADINWLATRNGRHTQQRNTAIGRIKPKMKIIKRYHLGSGSPLLTGRVNNNHKWYQVQPAACPPQFIWLRRAQEAQIGTSAGAGLVEMVENHQIDFALRMYIKYLTGCDITEASFPVQDFLLDIQEPGDHQRNMKSFLNRYILKTSNQQFDVNFLRQNPVFNNIFQQIESSSPSTANMAEEAINQAMLEATGDKNLEISESLKTFLAMFGSSSVYSGGARVKRKVLSPKKFDRVFHVCVDPDDFEVNFSATTNTNSTAINYFGAGGPVSSPIIAKDSANRYWMKPRNPHNGYVEVSQFFVTVSTVEDDIARDILCLT